MRERMVTFYVQVPEQEEDPLTRLQSAHILVPGWPDFGFRGEVVDVSDAPAPHCRYDDCDYEIAEEVEVILPAFLGPFRLVEEQHRKVLIPVCEIHAGMLRSYFVIDHVKLAFTLAEPD